MTMFCPKCGSLLRPKKNKNKRVLACSCGYTSNESKPTEIREEVAKQEKKSGVVDEDAEVLPETDAECPKCGNSRAYYWMQQTRAGDEPETRFLKCTKCKHIWRDYS